MFLTYDGRLQYLKSVLLSIQTYWSQLFLMPKKLLKTIEQIYKIFLWTGGVDLAKKALVAWDTLCLPHVAGGLNVLTILIWNRAALCKLLWNLSRKKGALWIKWVHIYFRKENLL